MPCILLFSPWTNNIHPALSLPCYFFAVLFLVLTYRAGLLGSCLQSGQDAQFGVVQRVHGTNPGIVPGQLQAPHQPPATHMDAPRDEPQACRPRHDHVERGRVYHQRGWGRGKYEKKGQGLAWVPLFFLAFDEFCSCLRAP